MLHHDKELFEKIILDTSEHFGIVPSIIEKDYYVTLFLHEIVKRQPDIIFKGGTSLSKCYHIINRFSEDIDLSIECEHKPTEGQKKNLVNNIRGIIDDYGFELKNPEDIRSRRDYNHFEVNVHSLFSSEFIKHDLIIETAVFFRSYPSVKRNVSSYVCEYLEFIRQNAIIASSGIEPFEIEVQALERTFVDKTFAVCDYYLNGKIDEHSRHLYDLYKMASEVEPDEKLKALFSAVREDRKNHKACPSATDGFDIRACLQEIIDKDIYKKDFENISIPLIFENITYETVKSNLQKIADSKML